MAHRLNNGLLLFTRERCNLRPPKRGYSYAPVKNVSIHHGGPVGGPRMSFARASETWRQWQVFHQEGRGWNDIGYNLGIDGLGRLYEGRPIGAVPAAVGGHNTGMVGIVFMQDGRYHPLNALQRRTLRILFEHGLPQLGLVPLGELARNPDPHCGVWGHNEYSGHESNECPGDHIMRHLKWRRSQS